MQLISIYRGQSRLREIVIVELMTNGAHHNAEQISDKWAQT